MTKPRFSVIVACRRSASHLKETLQALAALDSPYGGYEILVVDDLRHTGRGKEVHAAIRYGLPVRYYQFEGVGRAAAWNIAVRESIGEFVAFLDDGCIPAPGWLTAYDNAFDVWVAGVAGGSDSPPADAGDLEWCLYHILAGPPRSRKGAGPVTRYHPRTWNMAARKESILFAGGFDERSTEAPESPMIDRLEHIGYRTVYQPEASVQRGRGDDLPDFLGRSFRLALERGRGLIRPAIRRAYTVVLLLLAYLLMSAVALDAHPIFATSLWLAAGLYFLALWLSGVRAAIYQKSPLAAALVPPILLMHHAAHILGYAIGRLSWKRLRVLPGR